MRNEFNPKSIKKANLYLYKINAEKIEKNQQGEDGFNVKRSDKYEVLDINDSNFSLKFVSKVFVDPEALFCIDLEYRANFEFSHKIDKKFIDKNINELLYPIGGEMSYITSTLTKALTDHYIVMPPIISIDEKEDKIKKKKIK
jgi:hypothetical protein